MKKKMMINTVASLLAQLVAVIYGFVLPRLILEQYGSEVNGLTQSIKQFLGVISFLDLGVGQVVRSALYRPLSNCDNMLLSQVMASGGKFYKKLAYALAGYAAILSLSYPLLVVNKFGWTYTASLIAISALGSFCQYYFGITNEQLLHADQRSYVIFLLQIGSNLLNTALCVWIIHAGGSIHAIKMVTALVYLIRPTVTCLYVDRYYRIDRKAQYDKEPVAQKWNGIAQHISAVVLDGTDTIVLTLFSTLSNVSVYSVYYMVIGSIQQFYQAATSSIHAAAGSLWATGDLPRANRLFETVEIILHTVTVFLFCCTGLLLVPFVQVYTNGLTDADYIRPLFAAVLVLAYGIRCLRTPYNIWILAAGHYKQTQKCHIIAAVLNLTISILALSQWGLLGVAVGTLCAMLYQTIWMAWYSTRHLLKRSFRSVAKQFCVDILTALLTFFLCSRFALGQLSYLSWFWLAVKTGCVAAAVSAAMVFVFSRRLILNLLHSDSMK